MNRSTSNAANKLQLMVLTGLDVGIPSLLYSIAAKGFRGLLTKFLQLWRYLVQCMRAELLLCPLWWNWGLPYTGDRGIIKRYDRKFPSGRDGGTGGYGKARGLDEVSRGRL